METYEKHEFPAGQLAKPRKPPAPEAPEQLRSLAVMTDAVAPVDQHTQLMKDKVERWDRIRERESRRDLDPLDPHPGGPKGSILPT
jgi:hypothetical protein